MKKDKSSLIKGIVSAIIAGIILGYLDSRNNK